MQKEWYKKIGYNKNPFHIEPGFKDVLLGHTALINEIFYRIDSGNLIFIEGQIGKTSLLIKIIKQYHGKGKVAYVNCNKLEDVPNIKEIIYNNKKNKNKKIGNKPKNMIILLDNVSKLSYLNSQEIKYLFDQGCILSIIMTGNSFIESNIPNSLKHRVGKRVYKIRNLTKDEMVDIILERIDFNDKLDKKLVNLLADKSDNIKSLFKEISAAMLIAQNLKMKIADESIYSRLVDDNNGKKVMVH